MSSYKGKNIKELSLVELENVAQSLREDILEYNSINGGHLGSNLGIVEITLGLHRVFDFPKDKLLFDVGHQCYAHKLLTSRSLETLRKKDGISGFQKRDESEYDCFEAGHSSTSLSAALGMAISRDLNKEDHNIIALIGDGSVVSGPSFEALNNLAHINNKIIIILNDNEMSISRPVGGTAKLLSKIRMSVGYNKAKSGYQRFLTKTKIGHKFYKMTANVKDKWKRMIVPPTFFESLGLDYLGPIDGHNLKSLEKALKKAKKAQKTIIIHCHTVKGKGYKYAENDKEGKWHGVGPFNKETGEIKCSCNNSWSSFYSSLVFNSMKDERLVYVNPAMIRGFEAESIFATYKERAFDVGIAEEHAVSLVSGLALSKKHPILAIYSTFLQRAIDQVNQDLCRMSLPCTILIDRAGLVGQDGETHQGIFDEGLLITNPNIVISMPSSEQEAEYVYNLSLSSTCPFVIRYPRDNSYKSLIENVNLNEFMWPIFRNNQNSSLIIGVGGLFNKLSSLIIEEDLPYDLMNALFIKPLDEKALNLALKYQKIVIYNPYSTRFGLVNEVLGYLLKHGYKGEVIVKCINDEFIKQATIEEQLKDLGLDLDSMMKILR